MRSESAGCGVTEPVVVVRPAWLVWSLAVVAGLAGGVLTSFGQTVLSGGWLALANSASSWVMFAFGAGLFVRGRWEVAAFAGLLTQVGLVAGYYATTELRGFPAGMAAIVIWIAAGAVAGPVYGAAGAMVRYPPLVDDGSGAERPDDPAASAAASVSDGTRKRGRDAWGSMAGPYADAGTRKRGRDAWVLIRVCAAGVTGAVWVMEGLHFLSLAGDANSNSGPGVVAGWCYLLVGALLPLLAARTVRERLYALLALAVATGLAAAAGLVINASFFI